MIQKLIDQLDYEWKPASGAEKTKMKANVKISEERATLLYVIDTYSKHLVDC